MPPSVLFGLHKSDSASTGVATKVGGATAASSMFMRKDTKMTNLPKMSSAQNLNTMNVDDVPKSRSSYRTTRGFGGLQSSIGTTKAATRKPLGGSAMRTGAGALGFSQQDINSVGMNVEKMMKLNNVLELDKKFTLVERGKFKVNPKA